MARAPRLAPDDRRQAIVAATVPLLVEHGPEVSTRQIAEACGIAEGTLFRAFPNKEAIVAEAIRATLDPTELLTTLAAIDPALPLEARLRTVVEVLDTSIRRVSEALAALFRARQSTATDHHKHHGHRQQMADDQRRVTDAIAEVLRPDAARLEVDLDVAASLVRTLVFASVHPMLADGRLADPDLRTRLLLKALTKEPS